MPYKPLIDPLRIAETILFVKKSLNSFIGRDDIYFNFFCWKSPEICSGSNLLFRGLTLISFEVQFFSFIKRNANSANEQQKCKTVTENVIDFSFENGIQF